MPDYGITINAKLMPPNNSNKHIPSLEVSQWITPISNGLKLKGPLPTSTNVYGLGDGKMCQTWWIKWITNACNLINVPHGGLGSNVETWTNEIPCDLEIANFLFGGSCWSWMWLFNNLNQCGRPKSSQHKGFVGLYGLSPNEPHC